MFFFLARPRDRERCAPLAALAALLLLLGPSTAPAAAPPIATPAAKTSYYGVYLRDAKLGSFVLKRTDALRQNVPAIRMDATMVLDMRVLGASAKVVNTTVSWSDRNGVPLALDYTSEAAGNVTHVSAAYNARSVSFKADIMGTVKSGTLHLQPGETFLADTESGAAGIKPQPQMRLSGKVFSPETLTLLDSETRVVGQEPVALGGQSVPAYKVQNKSALATSTLWLTEAGDLLRLDSVLGIQVRREPKEQALAEPGRKLDIALAVGITPTGEDVKQPRTLRRAEYEITGLTRPLPVKSNGVQAVTHAPVAGGSSALRARVTVTASPLPEGRTVALIAPGGTVPKALQPYLSATTYVPADDPQFRDLARTIVGGDTDAARAAAKIAAWVHEKMTPDPSIAALRPAPHILKDPRGVCRDYTTLFTAIARAAGLPTKQCVGVAYVDGRFVYHAWPEVWVGNDRWVALEPTWGAPFADATHIKLAEGEITDAFSLAHDMGSYQIKVLSAR